MKLMPHVFLFLVLNCVAQLGASDLKIPLDVSYFEVEMLSGHSAFETIENGRRAEDLRWVRDPDAFDSNAARLHAAVAFIDRGQPLSALRYCEENLKAGGEWVKESRDLAARIHAAYGEFSWAYRLSEGGTSWKEGEDSKYWLGAYLQFNERLQRGLIENRVMEISRVSGKSAELVSIISRLTELLAIQLDDTEEADGEISFSEGFVSILESDLAVLRGGLSGQDWSERFSLFRESGFDLDAGIAAGRSLWDNGGKGDEERAYLEKVYNQADVFLSEASKSFDGDNYYDALANGIQAVQANPCSVAAMSLVFDVALANLDEDLAVSMLSLRWQAGDDGFNFSEALKLAIQKGDFALVLSLGMEAVKRHDAEWDTAYYLALAARAWDLPFLEARALRVLYDTGFQGGIYHMQDIGRADDRFSSLHHYFETSYSSFWGSTKEQPLIESLVWRLERDLRGLDKDLVSPEEQLERLSKIGPNDQLHLAYFLDLIDDVSYLKRAELPSDKSIAEGVVAFVQAFQSGTISQMQTQHINGLLQTKEANPFIKAAVHWQLVRSHQLSIPRLRASDLVFAKEGQTSGRDTSLVREGAVISPEVSWKKSLTETADYAAAQKSIKSYKKTEYWPQKKGDVFFYSLDPRTPSSAAIFGQDDFEKKLVVDYFLKRDRWLLDDYWIRSAEESPLLRVRRANLLFEAMSSGQEKIRSMSVEASQKAPSYIRAVSHNRTELLDDLAGRLQKANRSGESDAIMVSYLFEDPVILAFSDRISMRHKELAKSQAKSFLSSYSRKEEAMSREEHNLRSIASGLTSPDSPFFQAILMNLKNGSSQGEVSSILSDLRAEAFAKEQRRKAELERQRVALEERARWLEMERQKEEARNRPTPEQIWAMKCNAYWLESQRQPTVIRNYLPNGSVEIIVKR